MHAAQQTDKTAAYAAYNHAVPQQHKKHYGEKYLRDDAEDYQRFGRRAESEKQPRRDRRTDDAYDEYRHRIQREIKYERDGRYRARYAVAHHKERARGLPARRRRRYGGEEYVRRRVDVAAAQTAAVSEIFKQRIHRKGFRKDKAKHAQRGTAEPDGVCVFQIDKKALRREMTALGDHRTDGQRRKNDRGKRPEYLGASLFADLRDA